MKSKSFLSGLSLIFTSWRHWSYRSSSSLKLHSLYNIWCERYSTLRARLVVLLDAANAALVIRNWSWAVREIKKERARANMECLQDLAAAHACKLARREVEVGTLTTVLLKWRAQAIFENRCVSEARAEKMRSALVRFRFKAKANGVLAGM